MSNPKIIIINDPKCRNSKNAEGKKKRKKEREREEEEEEEMEIKSTQATLDLGHSAT